MTEEQLREAIHRLTDKVTETTVLSRIYKILLRAYCVQ